MKSTTAIIAFSGLFSLAYGHGFVTSPQARMPGTAMEAACGTQVYDNQKSDNYGNIQNMLQVGSSQSDFNASACNVWQCKGYKFADNTANVQSYTAGQVVDMVVDIRAPHTGTANVSIVDTASNTIIGDVLTYWSNYASTATGVTRNETNFSITIPSDLGDKCTTAGDCVIQWWWDARSIDQTYEACIDFTVGGSGSSSSSPSSSASASASASASKATSASTVVASASKATSAATSKTSVTSVVVATTTAGNVAVAQSTTLVTSVTTATSSATSTSATAATSTSNSAESILSELTSVLEEVMNYDSRVHARDIRVMRA